MNVDIKLLNNVLDSLPCGAVVHSGDGSIIYGNPTATDLLGVTLDQLIGRNSADHRWEATDSKGNSLAPEEHPAMIALATKSFVQSRLMNISTPNNEIIPICVSANYICPDIVADSDSPAVVALFHLTEPEQNFQSPPELFRNLASTPSYAFLRQRFKRVIVALEDFKAATAIDDKQRISAATSLMERTALEMDCWREAYERLAYTSNIFLSQTSFHWQELERGIKFANVFIDEGIVRNPIYERLPLTIYAFTQVLNALCGEFQVISVAQCAPVGRRVVIDFSLSSNELISVIKGDANLILSGDECSMIEHQCFRELFSTICIFSKSSVKFDHSRKTICLLLDF